MCWEEWRMRVDVRRDIASRLGIECFYVILPAAVDEWVISGEDFFFKNHVFCLLRICAW